MKMAQNKWFLAFFNALPVPAAVLMLLFAGRALVSAQISEIRVRRDIAAAAPAQKTQLLRSVRDLSLAARRFSEVPYGHYKRGYGYDRRRGEFGYPRPH